MSKFSWVLSDIEQLEERINNIFSSDCEEEEQCFKDFLMKESFVITDRWYVDEDTQKEIKEAE